MKTILCFGNEFVKGDKLAVELAGELKVEGFEFVQCDSPERILDYDDVLVMDVADVDKVMLVDDAGRITSNPATMHDLDLGFFLKLAKQFGKPKSIKIIALPKKGDKKKIKAEILKLLRAI